MKNNILDPCKKRLIIFCKIKSYLPTLTFYILACIGSYWFSTYYEKSLFHLFQSYCFLYFLVLFIIRLFVRADSVEIFQREIEIDSKSTPKAPLRQLVVLGSLWRFLPSSSLSMMYEPPWPAAPLDSHHLAESLSIRIAGPLLRSLALPRGRLRLLIVSVISSSVEIWTVPSYTLLLEKPYTLRTLPLYNTHTHTESIPTSEEKKNLLWR